MRKLVLLLMGVATSATAHDFWIQPQIFAAPVGKPVPVTIEVGHGSFRQRWSVASDRVVSFTTVGPGGSTDRRADLHLDSGTADAELRFATPGTYVIVLTTNHASSNLTAFRFNDYAKTEGLTPALVARARAGTTEAPGREIYSRRAKALVQIGTASGPQSQVTKPLGLTLEIVPERDPYALKPDETLPVRIYYDGRPLAGALVKLTNLDFDARPLRTAVTDARGRATFKLPFRGLWQLNGIWTKAIAGNPDAHFASTFSSLTFGTTRPGKALEGR